MHTQIEITIGIARIDGVVQIADNIMLVIIGVGGGGG
jgi:hypothetical protein